MSDNQFGKYGLTGDSGFIGDCHFSAPYDCNGMVFVEHDNWWKRMDKKEAKKKGLKIIKCEYCDKPAVSLDHHWPYMSDTTVCAKHFKERGR